MAIQHIAFNLCYNARMKKIVLILVILALIAIIWVYVKDSRNAPKPHSNNQTSSTASTSSAANALGGVMSINATNSSGGSNSTGNIKTFTIANVANHKGEGDCWTIIGGKVYNLTSWIHQHPGGDRNILKICGIDGTRPFEQQHGSSAEAQTKLTSFYIGDLVK